VQGEDVANTLAHQRSNLLAGIKDASCNYCWKTEENGKESMRHIKLREWAGSLAIDRLQLNIGNLCNFTCAYCNSAFSSQWEGDLKTNGPYDIKFDAHQLNFIHSNTGSLLNKLVSYYNSNKPASMLTILGGEPFITPLFSELIDQIDIDGLTVRVATNLNFKSKEIINTLLSKDAIIEIQPSIDASPGITSYIRAGFDFNLFNSNLHWLLDNTTVQIRFLSLITAHTVWGLNELHKYIYKIKEQYPGRILWSLENCKTPRVNSFEILTPSEKIKAQSILDCVKHKSSDESELLQIIINLLTNTVYNNDLRTDQQSFFKQFSLRNKLAVPDELKFLIEDNIPGHSK